MDNLSHTLAGLAAAELLHRALPAEPDRAQQDTRHRLLLVACLLASNFPDLDLILTPLLPAPLGYLLHHRGHTHTFLYALPQALLLSALLWFSWPKARALLRISSGARRGLALSMVAGFGLHLAMDALNSYGLHPFHPFDSRWLYGDMVFIIEPVFWVTLGVPLILLIRRAWLRRGLLGLLASVLAYFSANGFLHWGSLLTLVGFGLLLVTVHGRRAQPFPRVPPGVPLHGPGRGILIGLAGLAVFLLAQALASQRAAHQIGDALTQMDPASQLLDSARSAFPANPLCWSFVSIESNEKAGYFRLRRGVLSVAPQWLPLAACPPVLAERDAQQHVAQPGLALLTDYQGSLASLRALQRDNCHFEAWMRFARAPQVLDGTASDLRFARTPQGNFTAMELDDFEGQPCPKGVPRWAFPRADLLHGN